MTPTLVMFVWIFVAGLVVHKAQRVKAMIFCVVAIVTMLLQIELVLSFNIDAGLTGWWEMPVDQRGIIGWSVAILCYLLLSWASPASRGVLYFAASMSIYLIAVIVTSGVMLI